MRIVVGVLHSEHTRIVAEIRKWKRESKIQGWKNVEEVESRDWSCCFSDVGASDLVVAAGVNRGTVHAEFKGIPRQIIVFAPSDRVEKLPTASLLDNSVASVESLEQLKPSLEKMILRSVVMQNTKFRRLETAAEFEQYLRLRYRVWREKKYYHKEGDFEADYCDRSAIHFGLFQSNKLIAAARLIFPLGQESQSSLSTIESVLRTDSTGFALARFLEKPRIHSFDALEVLPELNVVYRDWVTSRSNMTELSRVVVDKKFRRTGLGSVLVDTTLDFARASGVDLVFLACRKNHEIFYRRSGFLKIPSVSASQFFEVKASVIAMANEIKNAAEPSAVS